MKAIRPRHIGITVFGMLLTTGTVVAAATVWLLLTNPATIAEAVNEGRVSPFVRDLAKVIFDALRGLLRYL